MKNISEKFELFSMLQNDVESKYSEKIIIWLDIQLTQKILNGI